MRPFTKINELASAHQVTTYLHNEFVRTMQEKAAEVSQVIGLVAACADVWSSPSNKMPYLGAMSAYILIVKRKNKRPLWVLKSTILGFRAIEGQHDGGNLGRYFFGLCRRAGIIDVEKKISKACDN